MASANLEKEPLAQEEVQKCIFGLTKAAAVRCAVELGIPDIVENHPDGVTLTELSSELGCSSSLLHRLMRFLTYHRIFKEVKTDRQDSPIVYAQTAISHVLIQKNVAPFFLFLTSPAMSASLLTLSNSIVSENSNGSAFEAVHGMNVWQYIATNPSFGELFHNAMAWSAQFSVSKVIENCLPAFEGIRCLVDVGGGNGTTLNAVVKACPWITRAINFDLPNVVPISSEDGRVEHVGGDMFVAIPSADAALLRAVLHDWDDEACVKILKKCRESIPKETGKVIIVEMVLPDGDEESKFKDYQFAIDIEMMAHTIKGRERTSKDWANLLTSAGFSKHTIKHTHSFDSVIEAYP